MEDRIHRIGVVGGGIMGTGIAEVCARSGAEVLVAETDGERAAAAQQRMFRSLDRAVRSGKLNDVTKDEIANRVSFVDELSLFADRELVIEAISEEEAVKVAVFSRIDQLLDDPEAIIASNTSSIPIMKLAVATNRHERVLGLHFFNPVPVLDLVEVVPSLVTTQQVLDRAERFVENQLGKSSIRSMDRAGFIVNSLLIPYLLSAIRMLESGFATAEDIDGGMVMGCAHPMGPLALTDLIGLDTTQAVAESMYEEFKEPLYSPPPLLSRMVDAGHLGRKASRGFYPY